MTLAQITWNRLGVDRLAGPTMRSHQPGLPVIGCGLARCWSPVSAWNTRIAFDLSRRELAVRLVGHGHAVERLPAVERERLGEQEAAGSRGEDCCHVDAGTWDSPTANKRGCVNQSAASEVMRAAR